MTLNNATNSIARTSGDSPFKVGHFLINALPNAADHNGGIAVVTNGDGGNIRTIYSDGTNWRFVYNNEIVTENPSAPTENETYDLAIPAAEAIQSGDIVALVVIDGVLKAKPANYLDGFTGQAQGFAKDAVAENETAYIYRKRRLIVPKSGLQINTDYYLSNNGQVFAFDSEFVFPSGSIYQFIGRCLPDGLEFDPSRPILKY